MEKIKRVFTKLLKLKPRGFWPGFLIGVFYFSYIFWWLWSLYPLDTLGIENNFYAAIALLFVFSVSVISTAFFWGVFSFLGLRILKSANNLLAPTAIAGLFVILEYLRSWGFGIIWWGSGSLIGSHWTLGNPVYLLSFSKYVLDTASVWGIYGIDFLLVWVLYIVLLLATGKYAIRSRTFLFNLGLIILIFLATIGLSAKDNETLATSTIKISLIQTRDATKFKLSADEMLDNYAKKLELLREAASTIDGGIIVFPESSNFSKTLLNFLDSNSAQSYFNKLSDKEFVIIDNNILSDQESYKSRTLFINSKNGVSGFYDKQLLTPTGEYLPYLLKFFLSIFQKNTSVFESPGLKAGTSPELLSYKSFPIKILACSDVLSPSISSQGRYDLLVSLQNLGLFKEDRSMGSLFLAMLRFRAAENGKYAVLASNYGRSYMINSNGSVIKSTDSPGYQILTANIVPNKERTWYNKLGDLPILLLSLAVFGLGIKNFRNAE